jgi:hypothetical protein
VFNSRHPGWKRRWELEKVAKNEVFSPHKY